MKLVALMIDVQQILRAQPRVGDCLRGHVQGQRDAAHHDIVPVGKHLLALVMEKCCMELFGADKTVGALIPLRSLSDVAGRYPLTLGIADERDRAGVLPPRLVGDPVADA